MSNDASGYSMKTWTGNLNNDCEDFGGRYTCEHFLSNGGCKHPKHFMCNVYVKTNKVPVEDDLPLFVGEVLDIFEGSSVVKITGEPKVKQKKQKRTMEDFFGKI